MFGSDAGLGVCIYGNAYGSVVGMLLGIRTHKASFILVTFHTIFATKHTVLRWPSLGVKNVPTHDP